MPVTASRALSRRKCRSTAAGAAAVGCGTPDVEPTPPTALLGCPVDYGASAVERRLNAFARHWPLNGHRLLDVGCGNGAYTVVLGAGFDEVHAVDVEAGRLETFRDQVRGNPKFHIAQGTAERLEYPKGHFDVVSAIEVIEHIGDLDQAISEVHRVLRSGGAFLVSCPNRLFPLETHTIAIGARHYPARRIPFLPYVKPLHRRLSTARNFTTRDLRRLICPVGFEAVAWDWVMPPLDHWTLGTGVLRPLLDRLEASPARRFGVSIVAVFQKLS
jgi:ubiquinone/menaquinone biosynthesis C-methylase UbiE